MCKIIVSLFCLGLMLNIENAMAAFPPTCPDIQTMINKVSALTTLYGSSKHDNWYYYFQFDMIEPDGNYVQITYYSTVPPSDPVTQIKALAPAFGSPQIVDVPLPKPDERENVARECVYLGSMDFYGNPVDDPVWHQVLTLRYSLWPLVNLRIDTGDLPPGSVNFPIELTAGSRIYDQDISSGKNQEFQAVPYGGYDVIVPTTIHADGVIYQLILNNPYEIRPDQLENGDTLLLNYRRAS